MQGTWDYDPWPGRIPHALEPSGGPRPLELSTLRPGSAARRALQPEARAPGKRVGPLSARLMSLLEKSWGGGDLETEREGHVKMEAELGLMQPQARPARANKR